MGFTDFFKDIAKKLPSVLDEATGGVFHNKIIGHKSQKENADAAQKYIDFLRKNGNFQPANGEPYSGNEFIHPKDPSKPETQPVSPGSNPPVNPEAGQFDGKGQKSPPIQSSPLILWTGIGLAGCALILLLIIIFKS
jgi:hypothetical protein